jgi:pilus assembly protein CpaD
MTVRLIRLSLALGLALAGCTAAPPRAVREDGLASVKTLRVDHTRLQHDVAFAPGAPDPLAGETDRLMAFIAQSELRGADHVLLEPSEGDRLAAARIGRLVKALGRRGIGARSLPASAEAPPDRLRVLVDRYVVVLPDCPDWTASPQSDHDNLPSSNFGCASATNLGLMLADPHDLLVGREPGPADADPAVAAVTRYRAGQTKSLSSEDAPTPTINFMNAAAGAAGAGAGGASQ